MERRLRLLCLTRATYGMLLLAVPSRLARLAGALPDSTLVRVARILGLRHLSQAVIQWLAGERSAGAGTVVDGVHAASMFLLAAADRPRARPALIDATGAAAFAAVGFTARQGRTP